MDSEKEKGLGLLVLEQGLLTEEQLEIALADHLSSGKRLGDVLVERGWLTTQQLADLFDRETNGARGIELLRTRVAEAEAELEPAADELEPDENGQPGYLLFVWNPSGYELISRSGAS